MSGAFMYEGDSPLAERRAAALSLDSVLLAELLGRVELRELLDPQVIATTARQLQHLSADRAARDAEGVADLLRLLGPLTEHEIAERCYHRRGRRLAGGFARRQAGAHGVVRRPDAGGWRSRTSACCATASGWRCRSGCRRASPKPSPTRLGELLGRYARTHGPFTTDDAAARFGLGLRVTADVLGRLAIDGRLVRGEFTDTADAGDQWCDADVLKILRRRSLAALRAQVEPVSTAAYGRFLPAWHQVASTHNSGVDGLAAVIDQLAGVPIPASAVEPLVFGQRVRDYQPAMLDELLAAGEVTWSGAGQIGGGDGWIAFHPADSAPLTLAAPAEIEFTDTHRAIMDTLGRGGAYFFRQLRPRQRHRTVQTGTVGTDLGRLGHRRHVRPGAGACCRAPAARARVGAPAHRHRQRPPRLSRYSVAHAQARSSDPTVAGRWSALPAAEPDSTVRAHFQAELLLNRHGVLTKGAVAAEGVPGGFAMLYKVLTAFEDAGRCQRGYFVESLGGAQFAVASTVDRLRSYLDGVDPERRDYHAVVLAAADPANPYGAALPWPTRKAAGEGEPDAAHRPGRKAGALVALVDGELVWFLERGGRSLLSFADDAEAHNAAAAAVADLVGSGRVGSLLVEKVNGVPVLEPVVEGERAAVQEALVGAGFARTPRGLRLR